ncbi:MAG: hypothetical protein QM820_33795 [Minicystis sp.]
MRPSPAEVASALFLAGVSLAACTIQVTLGSGLGAGGGDGDGGTVASSGGTGSSTASTAGSGGGGIGGAASGTATLIFAVGNSGLNPWGIAVDAANVYFTDAQGPNGRVMKVPLDGSPASALATMEDLPSAIAVDATDVYFIAANALRRVPIAGGPAASLAPANDAGYASIAIDAANVYWTNYASAGSTMLLPKAGGTPTVVDSGDEYPSGIALAGGSVYWAAMEAGAIKSAPIAGGAVTVVASGQSYPRSGLATDGAYVYWVTEGDLPNHLFKAPLAGGPAVDVAAASSDTITPQSLVVDATHAYFLDTDIAACGLVKVELASGAVSTIPLGGSVGCPMFLAADAANVYCTTNLGIARIVK